VKNVSENFQRTEITIVPNTPITCLAVNPISKKMYLSIARGRGPGAVPVIVRVDTKGKIELVSMDKVKFSKVMLVDVPESKENAPFSEYGRTHRSAISSGFALDGSWRCHQNG
jgi:hypothetical protein